METKSAQSAGTGAKRGVAIIGATSAIALEFARAFPADRTKFFLSARNSEKLDAVAADLATRGAQIAGTLAADLGDRGSHERLVASAHAALGAIDIILIAHGTLPNQGLCEQDSDAAFAALEVNLLSIVAIAGRFANLLETAARPATIAVIGSVAGDRGRQSNYIYGTAKGGLAVFLQGLRNRLAKKGIHVLTVKPGFVDTPMTAHLAKGPLFASAQSVGRQIHRAVMRRADVVYVPGFWRIIMLVIRIIPERIFKRLRL